jgi:hypothetical protein
MIVEYDKGGENKILVFNITVKVEKDLKSSFNKFSYLLSLSPIQILRKVFKRHFAEVS